MPVPAAAPVSNLVEERSGWRNGGEQEEQGWRSGSGLSLRDKKQIQEEVASQQPPSSLLVYLLLGRSKQRLLKILFLELFSSSVARKGCGISWL